MAVNSLSVADDDRLTYALGPALWQLAPSDCRTGSTSREHDRSCGSVSGGAEEPGKTSIGTLGLLAIEGQLPCREDTKEA
jgi:hypothetical protein